MAKTYILEPTEVTFSSRGESVIYTEDAINKYDAITDDAIMNAFDSIFNFSERKSGSVVFEKDGNKITVAKPDYDTYMAAWGDFASATTTISIYTETEDEDPVDPVNPFSKNLIHNDHPYNDVDRIRTKLEQKADEDEGEDEGTTTGGGLFVVGSTFDSDNGTITLDKTYKEIVDAFESGLLPIVVVQPIPGIYAICIFGGYQPSDYSLAFFNAETRNVQYGCETENDYPTAAMN